MADRNTISTGGSGGGSLNLTALLSNFTGVEQTASKASLGNSNNVLQTAMTQANNNSLYDNLIASILDQSAVAFAPQLAGPKAAGLYNSTTARMMQDYAKAQAVSQSASAVLSAKGQATSTAAGITNAQMAANNSKTPTVDFASSIGKALPGALLSGAGMKVAGQIWDKGGKLVDKMSEAVTGPSNTTAVAESAGNVTAAETSAVLPNTEQFVNTTDFNSPEFIATLSGDTPDAVANVVTAADAGAATSNFQSTPSATPLATGTTQLASGSVGGVYSGVTAASDVSAAGDVSTAVGSFSNGSDLSNSLAAQGFNPGDADIVSAYSAADGTSTVSAADLGATTSSVGSAIGYAGPAMNAYATFEAGGTDYRQAVGGAVLNYFGFGALTPVVDAIVREPLDSAAENGDAVAGDLGVFWSDPIGSLVGGKVDPLDALTAQIDPANLLGGNEGGSVGGAVGFFMDPVGSLIGGKDSVGGYIADAFNDLTDSIGDFFGF